MACFRSWERDGHGEVGQGELIHGHSLLGSKYTLYSFKKPALALAALLAQACAKFITEMGPELEEGGERRHLVVQPLLPVPSAGSSAQELRAYWKAQDTSAHLPGPGSS